MKNKDFFNESEEACSAKLKQFNAATGLFSSLTQLPRYSLIDWSGVTKDNRRCVIELKKRNLILLANGRFSGSTGLFSDLFIEDSKVSGLLLNYVVNGYEPLYVNFMADGSTLIFNLAKLSNFNESRPITHSAGYGARQLEHRFGLLSFDACVYDSDNKLIKRMYE